MNVEISAGEGYVNDILLNFQHIPQLNYENRLRYCINIFNGVGGIPR
jgi:hypothetical protein